MRILMALLAGALALVVGGRAAQADDAAAAARPPVASRVMIVSIDGLRPDCALRADMPHLRGLMARGSFTFWAVTTDVAITLPSHTSMLTGVPPDKHKVTWNADVPHPQQPFPAFPTIFELAKRQGHTTALVAGKAKFSVLDKPGTLDWRLTREASDDEVASTAAAIIREHRPDLIFVHLPDCDRVGHDKGWGTPEQIEAIDHADRAFGQVLDALASARLLDLTLIIVTADHGGAGRGHGANDPRSRYIPWIAAGPGIKINEDLTRYPKLTVHTEDTFATACHVLGVPIPEHIDGKPVDEIFQHAELLNAGP